MIENNFDINHFSNYFHCDVRNVRNHFCVSLDLKSEPTKVTSSFDDLLLV